MKKRTYVVNIDAMAVSTSSTRRVFTRPTNDGVGIVISIPKKLLGKTKPEQIFVTVAFDENEHERNRRFWISKGQ